MSATATPKLLGYASARGGRALRALVLGRPELAVLATPFALVTGLGLVLAQAAAARARGRAAAGAGAPGRERRRRRRDPSDVRLEALELLADLPAGLSVDERAVAVPVPARHARRAPVRGSLRSLGRLPARRAPRARPRPARALRLRARRAAPGLPARLPARGDASLASSGPSRRRPSPATRWPGSRATGSSSPTCGRSSRAIACGGSTGGPARAATSSGSTSRIPSGTRT